MLTLLQASLQTTTLISHRCGSQQLILIICSHGSTYPSVCHFQWAINL